MESVSSFSLPTVDLPLENLISITALVIFAIYLIYSAILYYHWDTYATDAKVSNITLTFYLISTVPLLIIIGTATLML